MTVHCVAHATAALAAAAEVGRPVQILSAESAAGYAGPAWFAAMVAEAQQAVPAGAALPILDCGDQAGHALAALRHGLAGIRYGGPARDSIRAVAERCGAVLLDQRPASLDLADYDSDRPDECRAACLRWLSPGS